MSLRKMVYKAFIPVTRPQCIVKEVVGSFIISATDEEVRRVEGEGRWAGVF